MFVVEIGAFLTLFYLVQSILGNRKVRYRRLLCGTRYLAVSNRSWFQFLRPSLARNAAKAQADSLKKNSPVTPCLSLTKEPKLKRCPEAIEARRPSGGQNWTSCPGDGEIIQASINRRVCPITGDPRPSFVSRKRIDPESPGPRLWCRTVLYEYLRRRRIILDRMIALVEASLRQRTPNEIH